MTTNLLNDSMQSGLSDGIMTFFLEIQVKESTEKDIHRPSLDMSFQFGKQIYIFKWAPLFPKVLCSPSFINLMHPFFYNVNIQTMNKHELTYRFPGYTLTDLKANFIIKFNNILRLVV